MTSNSLAIANPHQVSTVDTTELLTVYINDQIFGLPILQVQDVLNVQSMTRIPLASKEIAGSLNLRGRIVTAIHVRHRIGLPPTDPNQKSMSIVVEYEDELYSLMFDRVGEVMHLSMTDYEQNPSTLDPKFRDVADGIYRMSEQLLVVIDIPKLLQGIGYFSEKS